MKLPYSYKGMEVHATQSRATGKVILEARRPYPKEITTGYIVIKRYIPPLQVIYLGYKDPPYAYDHDIEHMEILIDEYLIKIGK